MKRLALYLVLLVAALGALGWAISRSAGYVLITYDHFRYESTFWVFVGLAFGLWLLAFLVNRLLRLMLLSGALVNPWSRRHRHRRVEKASRHGQRELAEGNWERALGHLRLAADHDRRPLMHYLGAARAASEMGRHDESDRLLASALEREPDARLAIGLSRAQLLIGRGDYPAARQLLDELHREQPRHGLVLLMLQQLLVQLEDWRALCVLLPDLRKQRVLPGPRLDELERLAWTAALEQAGQASEDSAQALELLQKRWQDVPAGLRGDPALVRAQAAGLARLGAAPKAEELLLAALRKGFDESLVELYGRIGGADPARQLASAEAWLKAHPDNATLLLALGRLSMRCELWGKARDYLEASLRSAGRPETCAELGHLLARLGEAERSNRLFMQGLGLLDHSLPIRR